MKLQPTALRCWIFTAAFIIVWNDVSTYGFIMILPNRNHICIRNPMVSSSSSCNSAAIAVSNDVPSSLSRPPNRSSSSYISNNSNIHQGISSHLATTLDLIPLLDCIASYAHTKRGRDAMRSLIVSNDNKAPSSRSLLQIGGRRRGGGARRVDRYYYTASSGGSRLIHQQQQQQQQRIMSIIDIATSADMATNEYKLIHEAMDILLYSSLSSSSSSGSNSCSSIPKGIVIPLPPMFNLNSDNDMDDDDNDDDDDWIETCLHPTTTEDVYESITYHNILQAEQIVKLLLDTYTWGTMIDEVQWYTPGLANLASMIIDNTTTTTTATNHDDDNVDRQKKEADTNNKDVDSIIEPLTELYQLLQGAIEIVRAGPNLLDIHNRMSYNFQLSSSSSKFPELDKLRAKETRLLQQLQKVHNTSNNNNDKELGSVRKEMEQLQDIIKRKLIFGMIRYAPHVQHGMDILARLDIIFARASYGIDYCGCIPIVGGNGQLHVNKFVHPVLTLRKESNGAGIQRATPIDLLIPGKTGGGAGGGYRGLIISGPNGGGKTLALKSFGLVAMMAKLGIPITSLNTTTDDEQQQRPIVDYFDDILVEVGDSQSIGKQESTLMAKLNSLSSLIQTMSVMSSSLGGDGDVDSNNTTSNTTSISRLILLDELGGGTDPIAGGALSQSILEKLVTMSNDCSIIATTHSPQLKALSMNDDRFQSASVLMNNEKVPTFELRYGTTGESFALEAARRARPSLPDDVIQRAAELMDGEEDGSTVKSLDRYLAKLEQDQRRASEIRNETETVHKEVLVYKNDMISKIEVSRMQLSRLESRLSNIFDILMQAQKDGDTYELVGESLNELRLLKRKLQTAEDEFLSEKGLRRVSDSYSFREGETVVIIADTEWKGFDAVVKAMDGNDPQNVIVIPVLDLFSFTEDDVAQEELVLRRRDVAIFDYPNWGNDDKSGGSYSDRKTSRNNIMSVLSTLTTTSKTKTTTNVMEGTTTYISARQRKALSAAEKKQSKAKKR
jgi:hypothetical protein